MSQDRASPTGIPLDQALQMAWQCYREQRWQQAAGLCQQILNAMPQQPDAMHLLGLAAHRLGRSEAAVNLISGSIARQASAAACHSLGGVLAELGRWQEAARAYQSALALQPDFAEAHYNLGVALKAQGQSEAAIRCYRAALRSMPEFAEAHNNLGIALQDDGDAAQAAECYRNALRCKPGLAAAHYNLGNLLHSQNRYEEAEASYRAALALDAGHVDSHVQLGKLLQFLARDAEALASFEAALKSQPGHPVARHHADALAGAASRQAPAGYVQQLFDVMADGFDGHLGNLNYRVPQWLAEALCAELKPAPGALRALDLGCGTGLFGQHIHPFCRSLAGVDLSPKMLERAQARGCYTELANIDVEAYLAEAPSASLDLVAATDVFIYIGELRNIFHHVRRVLRPQGAFGFSIEAGADDASEFRLQRNGRYAQTPAYVRRLAAEQGLVEALCEPIAIRLEAGRPVEGFLCIFLSTRPAL